MCPVCGKKVGAWHKEGVHPKCKEKGGTLQRGSIVTLQAGEAIAPAGYAEGIRKLSQQDRDRLLRLINRR